MLGKNSPKVHDFWPQKSEECLSVRHELGIILEENPMRGNVFDPERRKWTVFTISNWRIRRMGLKGSVGAKADNFPNDVRNVRDLLNVHIKHNPDFIKEKVPQLPINGTHDMGETIRAIKTFQMYVLNIQKPTGRIDPGDRTWQELWSPPIGRPVDPVAPIDDRIHNQLLMARDSDYLDIFDSGEGRKGEIKCMIDLLLSDPSVDDRYIRDRYFEGGSPRKDTSLELYIKNADPDTVPPPINFTFKVRGMMKTLEGQLTYASTDQVVRFLAGVSDEMYVAYTQHIDYDALYALNLSPTLHGPYAASRNVEDWLKTRFSDPHSIYHCFPSILLQTKSVESLREWLGL